MQLLIPMINFINLQQPTSTFDTEQLDWFNEEIKKLDTIRNYANFLEKPLKLGFFVPCDSRGRIVSKPKNYMEDFEDQYNSVDRDSQCEAWYSECKKYFEAEKMCLFNFYRVEKDMYKQTKRTFYYIGDLRICSVYEYYSGEIKTNFDLNQDKYTLEDLVKYNLILTETALDQIKP